MRTNSLTALVHGRKKLTFETLVSHSKQAVGWLVVAALCGAPAAPALGQQGGSASLKLTPTSTTQKSASLKLTFNSPLRSNASASLKLNITEIGQRLGVQQVGEEVARAERRVAPKPAVSGPQSLVDKADGLLDQDKLTDAVDLYEKAIKQSPKLVTAHLGLGEAYLRQGDFDAAEQKYKDAITLAPNDAEVVLGYGVALYRSGRIDDAIGEYNKALAKQKNLPAAYYNLGLAYAHLGKFDQAVEQYQTAITQRGKNYPDALNNLGIIYEALGNLDQAEGQFRAAVAQRAVYPLARYNLSRILMSLGKYDEALAECKIAVGQRADFAEAYLTLGNLYLIRTTLKDTNEAEQAAAAFRKAIDLREKFYPMAHEHLAVALTLQGKKTEAYAEYRIAFDQNDGRSPEALENLMSTLLDNRDRLIIGNEQSRSANPGNLRSKRATTQKPTDQAAKGETDRDALTETLDRYAEIAEEVKNIPDLRYCVARAYFASGDWSGALYEMSKALEFSGGKDADAAKAVGTLLELVMPVGIRF